MMRSGLIVVVAVIWLTPAMALDRPVIWRDPGTGCGYFLTPHGGMSIRSRADGSIDCPNAPRDTAGRGVLDAMARELGRGLDALRRELDRLRQRPEERI
jgi:hypothetical protein